MHSVDVVALHLIGHSRGSVVISQAALDVQLLELMTPALAPLKAGPLKMTFLDPHPANNAYTGTLYSAAPNLLGQIGTGSYTWFQSQMQDPNVVVPTSADWAEVYYQHTSYQKATNPIESLFLIWGEDPSDITVLSPSTIVSSVNLTDVVPGHYLVHDWYQRNVIPTLGTMGLPGSTGMTSLASSPGLDPAPTAQPEAASAYLMPLAEIRTPVGSGPNRRPARWTKWLEGIPSLASSDISLGP
jgi:hypothetical protein